MPTRLIVAYSLIALSAAFILAFVLVVLRRRRAEQTLRHGNHSKRRTP